MPYSLSSQLNLAMTDAKRKAFEQGHTMLTCEHMLLEVLNDHEASRVLEGIAEAGQQTGAAIPKMKSALENYLSGLPKAEETTSDPGLEDGLQRALQRAKTHAENSKREQVGPLDFVISLFGVRDTYAVSLLSEYRIARFDVVNYNTSSDGAEDGPGAGVKVLALASGEEDVANGGLQTSRLASYCVNLNSKAIKRRTPLIGRDEEVQLVIETLARRTKNNPLLVGNPGVGKTAVAEGLALKIVEKNVPPVLMNATVWSLDLGRLVAGTKYRGDLEERVMGLLDELKRDTKSILFVDEIHTLMLSGGGAGGLDVPNTLKPALAEGSIRCIGATTFKEYRQHFERDEAMARRFDKIEIAEPSQSVALTMLEGLAPSFAQHHAVEYGAGVLEHAVNLSSRHITNRFLPDKAIDVIDLAGSAVSLRAGAATPAGSPVVTNEDIENAVAKIARIPVGNAQHDERKALKSLSSTLKTQVFGQDEAIDALAMAVKLARAGLGNREKPLGSFLFSGPSGVGKTEVCRSLATQLGLNFIRFDMSEYMEKHSVSRLIGSPPGYEGYQNGGLLTGAIKDTPFCVLLLDEIEKAHHDLFNLLLQVTDAGRLTGSDGITVDFRNVILVMTSNVGAGEPERGGFGFGRAAGGDVDSALSAVFSPEFRGRLDGEIVFKPLSEETMNSIVRKNIDKLSEQLGEKQVTLSVSDAAIAWLANKGVSKKFGARPLDRLITQEIKVALTDELLFGDLCEGGAADVDVVDGKMKVTTSPKGA